MATTKISQLPAVTEATNDDIFIINDGDTSTSKISFADLDASITPPALGDVQGVDLSSSPAQINDVLTWDGSSWVPGESGFGRLNTLNYQYSNNTVLSGLAAGQVRFDNLDPSLVTEMSIHDTDQDGDDLSAYNQNALVAARLYLQDSYNSSKYYIYDVNTITDEDGYTTYGLTYVASNGQFTSGTPLSYIIVPTPASSGLSNISDSAQGVTVSGRLSTTDLELGVGGQITAAGCTVDFSSATVIFSGAQVGGLQGEINDGVDFHINQSTATDGQVLSWNSIGGPLATGDYEWITPATGGGGSAAAASFTWDASLIPDTNAQYDLGNAEYKVRHLFLSDNSIKFDSGDLGVTEGRLTYADVPVASNLVYQVTNAGNDSYVLDGPGIIGKPNPRLHLTRGETYYFNNSMGIHPLEIRLAPGGPEYVDGVVNARRVDGMMSFTVPMDAPDTLVYQCTLHPSMVGEIYVMNDATTRIVDTNVPASNTDTGLPGEIRYGNSFLYICVSTNSWKRVALTDF